MNKREKPFGVINLIVVDEAHMISEVNTSMYRMVLDYFKRLNPKLRIVGLSATPFRLKGGLLTEQKNKVFHEISYDLSAQFNRLIADGYLAPLVTIKPQSLIDISNVRIERRDYKVSDVEEAMADGSLEKTLSTLCEVAEVKNRKHWLVFVPSIDIADKAEFFLQVQNIKAAAVHSKRDYRDNEETISGFKKGTITCLINVDKLTTGFDAPHVDLIAMLRPTISPGLHVQMLGRGTRPSEGKKDCLVLDFVGNIERLGPINDPVIPSQAKKGMKGDAPVKACPECGIYVHARSTKCPECGYEFQKEMKLKFKLMSGQVLAADPNEIDINILKELQKNTKEDEVIAGVKKIKFSKHITAKNIACLKVAYYCTYIEDNTEFSEKFYEFVLLDYLGFPRQKAEQWWVKHANEELPVNTDEALERIDEIKQPLYIKISNKSSKYPTILTVKYEVGYAS